MSLPRTHPHFRSKSKPEPIGEPRTGINKHTSTVNPPTEDFRVLITFRYYTICVM